MGTRDKLAGAHAHISLKTAIRLALLAGASASCFAPPAAADANDGSVGLDEIVVTATRRDTSILDVPYSISAISSTQLEADHVQTLSDLSKLIAGVSFVDEGPASRSNFVLRGINANGTDHPSTSTVAPVSTYIGETPLFVALQIDDIDRVEVLRGPQGTLYGSGSLAGTIRFIPMNPDPSHFSASIDADVADVAETNQLNRGLKGMINVSLNDISALRVSAGYQHYAGFIDENYIVKLGAPSTAINSPVGIPVSGNPKDPILGPMVFTPIEHANTSDLWHTRVAFIVKPNEDLTALISYYHQENLTRGQQASAPDFAGSVDTPAAGNPFYSPSYPVSFPTGGVVFPHNSTYDLNNSFLLRNDRQTDLVSMDLSYGFGFGTVSSSTSYYRDRGTDVADNTGELTLYPSFYGFIPRMVDYETDADELKGFVEEVRLVSKPLYSFDYVVGLFYQNIKDQSGQMQWIPGQTYFGTLVGDPGANADTLGDVNVIGNTSTTFNDRAAFGELTWHATDRWQFTGGIRFFDQGYSLVTNTAFPFCGIYCGSDSLGNTFDAGGYVAKDHISKLDTSYKVSEQLNAYMVYSEGFRRGGSNGIPISGPFAANPALLVYTPDKTKNYEIGAKGVIGGIHYTFDYFYINWDNFQVDTTAIASGFPIAVNGPKARSRGIELSLDGEITSHFSYQVGYSFANAEVARDFVVNDLDTSHQPVAIITGKDGDPLPNAPRHSANLGLTYVHAAPEFMDGWRMRWHLNGTYRSSTLSQLESTDPQAPPPFKIAGFSLWDAAVDLLNGHGVYTSLYAQNIFNQLGITGGEDAGEVGLRAEHFFVGRPRTIGLRVGYKF